MAQIGSTNVSMDTIKSTLQGGGGSVSNDLLTFFTTGAKINPWSKWKPIIIPSDFVDSDSSFSSYNYGISVQNVRTNSMSEAFKGSSINEWGYTLPTGGSSAPFRLGDFRKYRPDASSPFRELYIDKNEAIAGDTVTVELYCRMFNDSNEDGMIGLNDFAEFNGCKVAFIKKSPSGTLSQVISTNTIASNHGSVSATFPAFSTSSSERGTHTYMAALYKDGMYYRLPIAQKTVSVVESKLYDRATVSATCYSDSCSASLTYLRGTTSSGSLIMTPVFYFGNSSSQWIRISGSPINIAPGQYGSSSCLIDKYQYNSGYWSEIYSLAQADNLYVSCDAGGGTLKVNVLM